MMKSRPNFLNEFVEEIYILNSIKKIQKWFRKLKKRGHKKSKFSEVKIKTVSNNAEFIQNHLSLTQHKPSIDNSEQILIQLGARDKDGNREGFGINRFSYGAEYIGMFLQNKANGYGIFRIAQYQEEYRGEFRQDKANGFGIYVHAGAQFIGEWHEDLQNGIGIELWNDGSIYSGNYKQGKKHGYGTYHWSDGACYEGEWKENCLDGYVY
jgi:hypothetical protein